jgi:hypothetical protein
MKVRRILVSALLSMPLLASANIAVNGDFEDSVLGNGWSSSPTTGFLPVTAYIPCCSLFTGSYTGGLNAAFFGGGNATGGSIWQDLPTVIGQAYVLSFDYGAIAAPGLQTLTASALGDSLFGTALASAGVSATGTQALNTMLVTYSFSFTATDAMTRIQFVDTSINTNAVDGVLDNVTVSAVPEAEGYLMALAGMGFLTGAARRRKSK